jgi:hypothetical protein
MHEKVELFCKILDELKELHKAKSHDYATDIDPHSNFMSADDWGVEPWVGVMLRMQDKMKRLQTYAKKGKLLNEAAEDSFRDIAVYSIIALIIFKKRTEEKDMEGT